MDMDLESEEEDGAAQVPAPRAAVGVVRKGVGRNPYPLEGRYIDEDDRER
jgi:hypothetical protein